MNCVTHHSGCECYDKEFAQTKAKLARLEKAYGILKDELKDHTNCTTGYYSGQCTGDYYDAKQALAEAERVLKG